MFLLLNKISESINKLSFSHHHSNQGMVIPYDVWEREGMCFLLSQLKAKRDLVLSRLYETSHDEVFETSQRHIIGEDLIYLSSRSKCYFKDFKNRELSSNFDNLKNELNSLIKQYERN